MRRLIIPLLLLTAQAYAHTGSTFIFATLPPSPMANGRAGIFLGPEETDPLAAWSNPGLLGLMAQTQQAGATMYTERTKWLPGFLIEDLTFSARGVFVSWPQKPTVSERSWLPLGIAYTERYLDLGETQRTDQNGQIIGKFHSYERVQSLHFGISQQSKLWRFGLGTGLNYVHSQLGPIYSSDGPLEADAKAISADVGLWLDNNAVESARRLFKQEIPDNLFLRPSLGFAVTNVGPSASYNDALNEDPQPRTARITMGFATGIQIQHSDGAPWRLFTVNMVVEADDELVNRDIWSDYSYQFPPGDINPLTDVLLGQRNEGIHQKKAFEVSMFEMLFIRSGSELFEGDDMYKVKSSGWGLSLRGVMRLVSQASASSEISWIARHIDLQYHESRESVHNGGYHDNPRDGTKYQGIVLSYLR